MKIFYALIALMSTPMIIGLVNGAIVIPLEQRFNMYPVVSQESIALRAKCVDLHNRFAQAAEEYQDAEYDRMYRDDVYVDAPAGNDDSLMSIVAERKAVFRKANIGLARSMAIGTNSCSHGEWRVCPPGASCTTELSIGFAATYN
jgi:hypothetical protein